MGIELDVGEYVEVKNISCDNDALAGGTGDATEVTGDDIDMDGYVSGKVAIHFVTSLTADKTLSFELQKEDSAAEDGSKSADVVVQASAVAVTGAQTGYEGVVEIDIPYDTLKGWKRWVAFLITPELSHTSTDTVTWSATFIGIKRNVS